MVRVRHALWQSVGVGVLSVLHVHSVGGDAVTENLCLTETAGHVGRVEVRTMRGNASHIRVECGLAFIN